VKEAVSEVKRVARRDPILAGEGAVGLLERLSPALEHVDSSSGAIGTAVNNAIGALVPIIVNAPADPAVREIWLERLWAAHEADQMPYIEILTEYWGSLCASKEQASVWADRLVGLTRMALSPHPRLGGYFHGSSACLSALYWAERYDEVVEIVRGDCIWPYKRWAVKALWAKGHKAEALRYAESCRGPWTPDGEVDVLCEEILLSSGLVDEAYGRYGLRANLGSTYLATFRAVAKKYPHKDARQLLADLVGTTTGNEAKWFAAAKEAGLFEEALDLAGLSPCDPKTLARAARDFADKQPDFALGAGLRSLQWLVAGYGYEVTSADVWAAFTHTMKAAANAGKAAETLERVKLLVANEGPGGFVAQVLGSELGI
jgi:hypothetical protein